MLGRINRFISGRPENFSFIDEYASGSALPLSKREIGWIKKRGITAILSLTEKPLNPEWIEAMEYKNIPIKDHSIPTIDQLSEAVSFVLLQTQKNNKVMVHCLAGKGRTGTVLAAYLCRKYKLSPLRICNNVEVEATWIGREKTNEHC